MNVRNTGIRNLSRMQFYKITNITPVSHLEEKYNLESDEVKCIHFIQENHY